MRRPRLWPLFDFSFATDLARFTGNEKGFVRSAAYNIDIIFNTPRTFSHFGMLDFGTLFFDRKEVNRSFQEFHARKRSVLFRPDHRGAPSLVSLVQEHERILALALKSVADGSYILGAAKAHLISVDKQRRIFHFNWLDTFILFHMARTLSMASDGGLSDRLFSYREGKSVFAALNILRDFIQQDAAPTFVVRRDVKDFGEEMHHQYLLSDFQVYSKGSEALDRLFVQVCNFSDDTEVNKTGLPGGHFIQLVCENLYLRELDAVLERYRPGCYLRFGDDILFASKDRALALQAAQEIDLFLRKRRLNSNLTKARNFALVNGSLPKIESTGLEQQFEIVTNFAYLGTQIFWNGELAIPAKKLRDVRELLRKRVSAACRALSKASVSTRLEVAVVAVRNLMISNAQNNSEDSVIKILFQETRNERQLRELDRWMVLMILKCVLGRGFKKGHLRNFPPRQLREIGLPSLLHLRRTNVLC